MSASERVRAGFALAAIIAKDPGAEAACAGLSGSLVDTLAHTARELSQLGKAERRARIRALTEPPAKSPSAGHPRALALLAFNPRTALRGERQQTQTTSALPLPRPGYAPEPQLIALLARIAARAQKAAE